MLKPGTEQRRYERVKVSLNVNWGLTRECVNNGRITSISLGGYFLQTSYKLGAGQGIHLRLFFRDEHILRGTIKYSLPEIGSGVEFVELKEEDRRALQELIEFYKKG
ncbi:MAG TPA: PilZ domain-containing protein [Pyrinomonadaceae bacterium]|nr:PilZ domain-containing protein [Pyrinomonadaceae bacterium]